MPPPPPPHNCIISSSSSSSSSIIMAAVDYATFAAQYMNMADDDFPFDDRYSSSAASTTPYLDLSADYILLDDQYPWSAPLLPMVSTGGTIPSSSWQPPQGRVSPPLQVATNSTAAAAGGGGLIRVAFRTKTEVDVLDDGFKWRKYGKKSVKNSPNPRNYYRCSTEGCSVKKRVERDRDDPSYVITTYDGIHNHTSADVVYYATQDTASGQFVVSGRYGDTTTTPPNSST